MSLRMDRLRDLREAHGWSKRAMARLCGFGELQIHRYEAGISDPSTDNLRILADVLGVSADYLLSKTDDPRGNIGDGELDDNERTMLETYRRDGWPGVIRLGAERISK